MQMKNGFTYQGFEGEFQGGSYRPRSAAACSIGVQKGDCRHLHRGAGPRRRRLAEQSPAQLARFYARHRLARRRRRNASRHRPVGIEFLRRGRPRRRSNCSTRTGRRSTPGRRRRRTRRALVALNGKFAVDRELDAAEQCLCPQLPAGACRRQRRRRRALQQCVLVSQQAVSRGRWLPAPGAGHDGVPQPVRDARPEQQADSLPARHRQHLRAVPTARSTGPTPTPSPSALRCRRPTTQRSSATAITSPSAAASTTAGLGFTANSTLGYHLSRPVDRHQSGDPRQRRRSSTRSAISASSRSVSMRRTPITASTPPTRSTSRRSCR